MKQSREQLQAERDVLSNEQTLYLQYMHDVENGVRPDAIAKTEGRKDERIDGKLYRATSAHGGIAVIRYHQQNGYCSAHIHSLDAINSYMRSDYSENSLALRIVLERLTAERNRLCAVAA